VYLIQSEECLKKILNLAVRYLNEEKKEVDNSRQS